MFSNNKNEIETTKPDKKQQSKNEVNRDYKTINITVHNSCLEAGSQ